MINFDRSPTKIGIFLLVSLFCFLSLFVLAAPEDSSTDGKPLAGGNNNAPNTGGGNNNDTPNTGGENNNTANTGGENNNAPNTGGEKNNTANTGGEKNNTANTGGLVEGSSDNTFGPRLRIRLEEKLGKSNPSAQEIEVIKNLDLRGLGDEVELATLEGIDRFDNLEVLDLTKAKLEKAEDLENLDLPELKIFKFSQGKIDNQKPDPEKLRDQIKQFNKLEKCELRGNQLDKSFLNGLNLPSLIDLDLSENQIVDINSVGSGNLTDLKRLSLRQNPIKKTGQPSILKALDGSPNLEFLDLSEPVNVDQSTADVLLNKDENNTIDLPNLKNLNLKKTKFRRIQKLQEFPSLEKLNLSGNDLNDDDFLAGGGEPNALKDLIKLRLLDISDNPISDVTPIVRLAESKLNQVPRLAPVPNVLTAPTTVDPDLIVIASNTQLSSSQIQRLTELGVTVISDVEEFNLHLTKGLNMISLPLQLDREINARMAAQYMSVGFVATEIEEAINENGNGSGINWAGVASELNDPDGDDIAELSFSPSMIQKAVNDNSDLDGTTNWNQVFNDLVMPADTDLVSLLIRYSPIDKQFVSFLPNVDVNVDPSTPDNVTRNFRIVGGEGYIINLVSGQNAKTIPMSGKAWSGDNQAALTAPNSIPLSPWAFVVAGQLPEQLSTNSQYSVRLKQGDSVIQTLNNIQNSFRLTLVDMSRQPVVHEGQELRLEIMDQQQRVVGYSDFRLRTEDLALSYVQPNIQFNQIPSLTRLLQNYPNPFNPETWIPFELSQDSEVIVSIYDVSGQRVRQLDIGYHSAGIYTQKERAVYWDGKTENGETVASGIYFYNIQANGSGQVNNSTSSRRMVILK